MGLVFFLWSGPGRLLFLLLVTSLIPYAFTWNIPGGAEWRFTQHAYPFLLVASCLTIAGVAGVVAAIRPRRLPSALTTPRRVPALSMVAVLAVIGVGWASLQGLPYLKTRESLLAGDAATIVAGDRDRLFFTSGWSAPIRSGNVTARSSQGQRSVLRLPLPPIQYCSMTIRLDPYDPRMQPREHLSPSAVRRTVRLFVNNRFVTNLVLDWDPNRVGSYDVRLSLAMLRRGPNRIDLLADRTAPAGSVSNVDGFGEREDGRFWLWYVRVRPLSLTRQGT